MATWTDLVPGEPWPSQRSTPAYIRDTTAPCRERGCQAPELAALARHLSDEAHKTLETMLNRKGAVTMEPTRALWCEQGGHSFSEKDPDFQVLTIQGKDKEGKPVSESRTICGPCAAKTKTNLGSARNAPVTELPNGE